LVEGARTLRQADYPRNITLFVLVIAIAGALPTGVGLIYPKLGPLTAGALWGGFEVWGRRRNARAFIALVAGRRLAWLPVTIRRHIELVVFAAFISAVVAWSLVARGFGFL
jgi:hypothetical protein